MEYIQAIFIGALQTCKEYIRRVLRDNLLYYTRNTQKFFYFL